jgi:predicted N-acetyltransferase YhbS
VSLSQLHCQIHSLQCCPEHLVQVAQWHQSQAPQDSVQKRIDKLHNHLESVDFPTTLVAYNSNALIGAVSLVTYSSLGGYPRAVWLANLFVCPKYRNRGIGLELLRAAEIFARLHGCDELFLYTHDKDVYYKNRGWLALGSHDFSGNTKTIMRCFLDKR